MLAASIEEEVYDLLVISGGLRPLPARAST
jgi:hypothetical protein